MEDSVGPCCTSIFCASQCGPLKTGLGGMPPCIPACKMKPVRPGRCSQEQFLCWKVWGSSEWKKRSKWIVHGSGIIHIDVFSPHHLLMTPKSRLSCSTPSRLKDILNSVMSYPGQYLLSLLLNFFLQYFFDGLALINWLLLVIFGLCRLVWLEWISWSSLEFFKWSIQEFSIGTWSRHLSNRWMIDW